MTVQQTDYGFVFFFSTDELLLYSLHPSLITHEDALQLIRHSTAHWEEDLPSFPEIQVFSARSGILLFVRPLLSHCTKANVPPQLFS